MDARTQEDIELRLIYRTELKITMKLYIKTLHGLLYIVMLLLIQANY